MKKIIAICFILALAGFTAHKLYNELSSTALQQDRQRTPAQAVSITPVTRETLLHTAELTGTLVPEKEFIAAPKVSGRLENLYVNIGDVVSRGDLIAQLDSEEFMLQVQGAQADLEVSQAALGESTSELQVAERELNRARRLVESGSLSQSEFDQIQASYDVRNARHKVAQAQVRQKQAALEAAKVRLAYTSIRAAWSGESDTRMVGRRFASEGAMLQANEPIVSIVCTRSLLAVVNVIERDFPYIQVGQQAVVNAHAYPDKDYVGRVIRFSPVLEESSRQGRVEVLVPNPDNILAPGMFSRVRIEFHRREDVLTVPQEALARRDNIQGVFLADTDNMRARFTPVTTGLTDRNLVEIREPELEGYVVTLGHHLLEDNMNIIIPGLASVDNAGNSSQKN
ncbi:efflux RND transporter periplasmic adaptor subunit [Desulfonatronovibrio magnus]|uniref:efflux RND transporter periplasmic adaptor subunit n=1 Tax=Desulfonatronovibrio magnus TaxID=698827 RepID=UPI0005EB4EB4|nr:efflux RND transporter periplasmic adaptor subunit [Desulfonatronovibrio magnus]